MTTFQWTLAVVAVFCAMFTGFRMWNKDTKGAMLLVLVVIALMALMVVSGCTVSPERRPWLEAGFAYDTQHTVGSDPACIVRLRQPVGFGPIQPDWLLLGYEHHSSCHDLYDRNTIDQVELVARIPLGRERD